MLENRNQKYDTFQVKKRVITKISVRKNQEVGNSTGIISLYKKLFDISIKHIDIEFVRR